MNQEKMDDPFNKLPDSVVSHILSFLPTTKEAASTSVLAKRWRNLFAFVPNLDLDDSDFLHPEEGKREKDGVLQSFMEFVDRVLALQDDSPIKRFTLNVKTGVDPHCLDRWICNVLHRGVSQLDLFIKLEKRYSLPYEISVCKTLVELKTAFGTDLYSWNDEMFLPMLKTLVLDSVRFKKGQFRTILPACPVLEELMLLNMKWKDRNEILSSSSLKKLKIVSISGCLGTFSFDTPNLVFLEYHDFVAEDYPLLNLDNVDEVNGLSLALTQDRFDPAAYNAWKLIHGIRNVEKLYIYPGTLELLYLCCYDMMPVFRNLKTLKVKSIMEQGWQVMPVLLRNCPNLETLQIEGLLHAVTAKCGDVCNCVLKKKKGRSLMSCPVKKIRIQGFRGTMKEMSLIKHFLDYFPSLKEMEIVAEEHEVTEFETPGMLELVEEMLRQFNRESSCNVSFIALASLISKWMML